MTLMESGAQFKPRLVLWPRGTVLFGTNLHGHGADLIPADSLALALRCLVYHFHHQRSRLVPFSDWLHIAELKMSLSREAAFILFVQAQTISPLPREKRLTCWRDEAANPRADLLGLVVAVGLLSCGSGAGNSPRDVSTFVKENMELFLDCLLLCNYELATSTIRSARLEQLPHLEKVPVDALINLDPLFEGTLRTEKQMSTAQIVPAPVSTLLCTALHLRPDDQIGFADLSRILRKALQGDMFSLNDADALPSSSSASTSDSGARTMTSTQLAEHRKVTVRFWSHLEILTKQLYRGVNLRIRADPRARSSALFCPRFLRTALIQNLQSSGSVVLGPCTGTVVLQNLADIHIAAIADRVHVQNCHDIVLFVNCKTAPVIGCNCTNVMLAPYNCYYDALAIELQHAGMHLLGVNENRWSQPVQLDNIQADARSIRNNSCWDLLPIEGFYLQPTPFSTTRQTNFHRYFLETIPLDYLDAFEERCGVAETWLKRNPENRLIAVSDADRSYLLKRIHSP